MSKNYLCVSRKALTEYEVKPDARIVTVKDCRERPIKLQEVHTEGEDYYLKIDSPAKALKEESMNRSFRKRFEDGLNTIAASLDKKGGTKKYEAVLRRIGKLEGHYPSIARYYHIDVEKDDKGKATSLKWALQVPEKQVFGTYFLRTNVKTLDEMKKENGKRKQANPNPKAEYPTPYWTEIVRIMSTQKAVTSEAFNAMGERVEMRNTENWYS